MSAFYGESWAVDYVKVVAGMAGTTDAALYDRVWLHFDELSQAVTAGDAFTVGAFNDSSVLDSTDEVVTSWVLELGPSSAGTVRLSAGLDPTWSYSETVCTEALGEHTVSGASTLVVVTTVATLDHLLAFDAEPTLLVECLTGTVDILQVKLRCWPTTGPRGAWSTTGADPFPVTGGATRYTAAGDPDGTYSPDVGSLSEAWVEGVANLNAFDGQPLPAGEHWRTPAADSFVRKTYDTFFYDTFNTATGAGYNSWVAVAETSIFVPDLFPARAVDTPLSSSIGTDPREIRNEDQARVRAPGGGPLMPSVLGWHATITASDGGFVAFEAIDTPAFTQVPPSPNGLYDGPPLNLAAPSFIVSAPTSSTVTATPPGTGALAVTGYPATFFSAPSVEVVDHCNGTVGLQGDFLYPAYEYWDPGLPWVDEQPQRPDPRFFVRDLDGIDHPAGFGKPPDELHVFLVPTAMGMYRDLTTAEYDTLL